MLLPRKGMKVPAEPLMKEFDMTAAPVHRENFLNPTCFVLPFPNK